MKIKCIGHGTGKTQKRIRKEWCEKGGRGSGCKLVIIDGKENTVLEGKSEKYKEKIEKSRELYKL